MKALSHRTLTARSTRSQALIQARVREVFKRVPLLLGFSLDSELRISDVEVGTWPGCEWSDRVCGEIGAAIDELVARIEDEGASELLRERTFARALH
jgi:hypothetical protein